ncbi:MAG: bifunctional 4-hydroxy-3-methylbut-2-enyl diphosphate reductase/30S ribosomal protein S1 [Limnochordia bacterium]
MEVILAKNAGLCFGVKRALELATKAAKDDGDKGPIHSLGPLIHNPQAVAKLEELGVKVAQRLEDVDEGTLIIRSHGISPLLAQEAQARGLKIVDATCPFVRRSIRWVQELQQGGYKVVIVGEREHPEVRAVSGAVEEGGGWVVENPEEVASLPWSVRLGVVAQTTQSLANYQACVAALLEKTQELRVYHTICTATAQRQGAASELAKEVDLMVVVGGKNSANTRRLAEICGQGGTRTYHIETEEELDGDWFRSVKRVGVTAGASTPTWLIEGVIRRMMEFNEEKQQLEGTNGQNPVDSNGSMADSGDYDDTFVSVTEGQMITGKVVQIGDDEVMVDIGYKTEGIIPYREIGLRSGQNIHDVLAVGDEVLVEVLSVEDAEGNVTLSKRRADNIKTWETLEKAYEDREIIEARVRERVKGGLLVDVGVRGFVPASHVDRNYVENLEDFVGQTLRLHVIELDKERNNVVLSRKSVLEQEYNEAKEQTFAELTEGQVLNGIVRRITDFGAFVDIGSGVEGLLHVSEMAWSRVRHPSDIVSEGDEIRVMVLNVDRENERISLGLKQTLPDPWEDIGERYQVGQIVEGEVTRVVDFGAFVKLEDGVEGLVHISQMADHHVSDPNEIVHEGEQVQVKIVSIDEDAHRIGLSIREVGPKAGSRKEPKRQAPVESTFGGDDNDAPTIGDLYGDLAELLEKNDQ